MASPSIVVDEPEESTPLLRRQEEPSKCKWGARHTLALFGFLGITVEYCQRVCPSVVIVFIVNHANETHPVNQTTVCPAEKANRLTLFEGEFSWDKQTQGIILGAFFWGYTCTNVLGGRASEYVGGKTVFGLGILASSLFTLICPVVAQANVWLFVACRVLIGVFQGVTFPSVNSMLATWILPADRSVFSTVVYSGFQIGTVLGLLLSGCLTSFGGWTLPFYLYGAFGILWSVGWYFLIYDRPEDHPRISPEELRALTQGPTRLKMEKAIAIPWKAIVTSMPFWATMAGSLGNDFGLYTLLMELPTYLHDVQHFEIVHNGILSSVPYILMWCVSHSWANLMGYLTHRDKITLVNVRRLSMAVALYGPMLGFIGMCFVNCNATAAIIVVCIAGMLNGAHNSGFLCSHQDIAPNFAGTLLGITNTLGALSGIAAPAITSAIIGRQEQTLWNWRIIFLLCAAVYFLTCTFFIKFISADVQPWNNPLPEKGIESPTDVSSDVQPVPAPATVPVPAE